MLGDSLIEWLLDSDPALRWQVERDLCQRSGRGVAGDAGADRDRGLRRAAARAAGAHGQWAGGAFFPADFDFGTVETDGQPWTATTWTLNALREWGLDAAVLRAGTAELLAEQQPLGVRRPAVLGRRGRLLHQRLDASPTALWLGADVAGIVDWFVEHRLRRRRLELRVGRGLDAIVVPLDAQLAEGTARLRRRDRRHGRIARRPARRRGVPAARGLFRRLSTGEPVAPWVDRFTYPFRWRYSVLNAADYFREASLLDGIAPDPGMADAIEMIRAARQPDGTWLQGRRHAGPGVVRGRRTGGRAVEVADAVRDPGARMVGRGGALSSSRLSHSCAGSSFIGGLRLASSRRSSAGV